MIGDKMSEQQDLENFREFIDTLSKLANFATMGKVEPETSKGLCEDKKEHHDEFYAFLKYSHRMVANIHGCLKVENISDACFLIGRYIELIETTLEEFKEES